MKQSGAPAQVASSSDSDKMAMDAGDHIEDVACIYTNDDDDALNSHPPSRALWLITVTVAMGGFLFGTCMRWLALFAFLTLWQRVR